MIATGAAASAICPVTPVHPEAQDLLLGSSIIELNFGFETSADAWVLALCTLSKEVVWQPRRRNPWTEAQIIGADHAD
jgi:hypothetical protein